MQLAVGPTAVISLLTGQYILKNINTVKYTAVKYPDLYFHTAGQLCVAVGVYLIGLSFIRAGNLIRFVSYPVISGFTSGAAFGIGLSQVNNAFGFPSVAPKQGQPKYTWNFQVMHWFAGHWHDKTAKGVLYINTYAQRITFGIYFPLILVYIIKRFILLPTPERKKQIWFKVFTFISNIMPLIGLIIATQVAENLHRNANGSYYKQNLKIVGELPSGVNILRHVIQEVSWGTTFTDAVGIALIAFMESYSIAQKIARERNELHFLEADQELFANGLGNLFGSFSSAFPVCGSFSRSSVNAVAGARTPLSKVTTMIIICIALAALTKKFYYIPSAGLTAIIWVAITDLISPLDLWDAFKHSKKDAFILLTTWVVTFVWDTAVGAATGMLLSFTLLVIDIPFGKQSQPSRYEPNSFQLPDEYLRHKGTQIITLKNDFTFLTLPPVEEAVYDIIKKENDVLQGIILDFYQAKTIDWTGLRGLKSLLRYVHSKGVKVHAINVNSFIKGKTDKFGIVFDPLLNHAGSLEKDHSHGKGVPSVEVVVAKGVVDDAKDEQ